MRFPMYHFQYAKSQNQNMVRLMAQVFSARMPKEFVWSNSKEYYSWQQEYVFLLLHFTDDRTEVQRERDFLSLTSLGGFWYWWCQWSGTLTKHGALRSIFMAKGQHHQGLQHLGDGGASLGNKTLGRNRKGDEGIQDISLICEFHLRLTIFFKDFLNSGKKQIAKYKYLHQPEEYYWRVHSLINIFCIQRVSLQNE